MKKNKLFEYLVIPVVMLLVCMTFFTPIPSTLKLVIRTFFVIVFFILWRYFSRRNQTEARDLSFALLALNLAFLITKLEPLAEYPARFNIKYQPVN